jgi:hypothetical protein
VAAHGRAAASGTVAKIMISARKTYCGFIVMIVVSWS